MAVCYMAGPFFLPIIHTLDLVYVHLHTDTGGRAKDGTPIITCSSHLEPSATTELKEKEALDLLLHFSTLSRNGDKTKGFTIIVNGTTLTHTAMATLLQAVGKFQVGHSNGHTRTHTHTYTHTHTHTHTHTLL